MFNLPQSTLVRRVIPKKTLVDQLNANTRMKDCFTNDVVKVKATILVKFSKILIRLSSQAAQPLFKLLILLPFTIFRWRLRNKFRISTIEGLSLEFSICPSINLRRLY